MGIGPALLRTPTRVDYGVMLKLVLTLLPDASDRRKLLWNTPRELFRFRS
jgi:predicted TIM-barrel fold metal-dependent hydrolase